MFCILLANLRKWVKIPYNLLHVNEHFEGEHNDKIHFLFSLYKSLGHPSDALYIYICNIY